MAAKSMIGQLAVNLLMETASFEQGANWAEKRINQMQKKFAAVGQGMVDIGQNMTLGITAPLVAAGVGIIKATGNFEAGLNRIQIATNATTGEMKQMSELALKIGKDTTFGASEAAGAMEMLAKAGIDTKTILGGAAKAVTDLAAAAGSGLDPAASAISDSINQFHLAAKDLPTIVNQITGAVNESKFEFSDFTAGMAQGGGVAASAGLSFKDFAATLAATSSQFASGSDAGTSLKTFLLALTPTTKKAANAMAQYGLSFFDAAGNMKPMADIAEMLRTKFAGLSDETRNAALKDIFGTDAIRTAVGLMNQGAAGLDNIQAKLANTNAADQASKRMAGFNGQMEQLKGSLETLAIRIGQSGLLDSITKIVTALADLIDKWSQASPATLRFATIAAAVVAALGPLLVVLGTATKLLSPFIAAFAVGFGAGGPLLGAQAVLASITGLLGPFLPLLAAVAAAGYLIYQNWDKIGPALEEFWQALQKAIGPEIQDMIATVSGALNELWNGPMGPVIREAIGTLVELQVAWGKAFGPYVIDALKLLVSGLSNAVHAIADAVHLVSSLLNGDWRGAWEAALSIVNHVFGGLPAYINGIMVKIGTAIREWLINRLTAVWDTLKANIELVKSAFHSMYDAVVGHSYVPDMVDGIAAQMARLDGVMVKPAKNAAAKTKQTFEKLRDELRPLLDELFPDSAALVAYQRKLAVIEQAVKDKNLTPTQAEDARRNLAMAGRDNAPIDVMKDAPIDVKQGLDEANKAFDDFAKKTEAANVRVVKSFKDMATDTLNSLQGLAQSIKNGGIVDIFSGVLNVLLQLGSIGIFGKGVQTNLAKAPSLSYGGGRAAGGPVVPGKFYKVGENGPEWLAAGSAGHIIPNNDNGGATQVTIVPTPYFDAHVDSRAVRVAAPMATQAAMAGGQLGEQRVMSRAGRKIPSRGR